MVPQLPSKRTQSDDESDSPIQSPQKKRNSLGVNEFSAPQAGKRISFLNSTERTSSNYFVGPGRGTKTGPRALQMETARVETTLVKTALVQTVSLETVLVENELVETASIETALTEPADATHVQPIEFEVPTVITATSFNELDENCNDQDDDFNYYNVQTPTTDTATFATISTVPTILFKGENLLQPLSIFGSTDTLYSIGPIVKLIKGDLRSSRIFKYQKVVISGQTLFATTLAGMNAYLMASSRKYTFALQSSQTRDVAIKLTCFLNPCQSSPRQAHYAAPAQNAVHHPLNPAAVTDMRAATLRKKLKNANSRISKLKRELESVKIIINPQKLGQLRQIRDLDKDDAHPLFRMAMVDCMLKALSIGRLNPNLMCFDLILSQVIFCCDCCFAFINLFLQYSSKHIAAKICQEWPLATAIRRDSTISSTCSGGQAKLAAPRGTTICAGMVFQLTQILASVTSMLLANAQALLSCRLSAHGSNIMKK